MIAAGKCIMGNMLKSTMAEIAKDPQFVQITKVGHWLCEEAPDELSKTIMGFLGHRRAGGPSVPAYLQGMSRFCRWPGRVRGGTILTSLDGHAQ
jgi:hypothetical protein